MSGRRPLSLRNRISLVLVAVVAVALLGADVAVFALASRGLDRRVDAQLGGLTELARGLAVANAIGLPPPDEYSLGDPSDLGSAEFRYVALIRADGTKAFGTFLFADASNSEGPVLPDSVRIRSDGPTDLETTALVRGEQLPYRVRITRQPSGSTLVAAIPTSELADDRRSLILVEAVTTMAVLAMLAVLTRWLVGVSLRPLLRMEEAAERIAAGDLTHRVEPSGPETEISRLGAALNGMLTEIEDAFAVEQSSERRLRASEAKLRRFVADASHEMRTPLTSIRGYAQLLRQGHIDTDGERERAAGRIEDEAARLASLVDDLLLLARLDEDQPLRMEHVDLLPVLGQVVDDARTAYGDHEITLAADGDATMVGDADALGRAVANLVSNACRYAPAGTAVEVIVADVGAELTIDVVDHGPGVAAGDRPLLFDRFFRADVARSRDEGGTGLGLAIVDGIARAHGGSCAVDDTPGGGATFRLSLPHGGARGGTVRPGRDRPSARQEP